jgi:hypothetical protein
MVKFLLLFSHFELIKLYKIFSVRIFYYDGAMEESIDDCLHYLQDKHKFDNHKLIKQQAYRARKEQRKLKSLGTTNISSAKSQIVLQNKLELKKSLKYFIKKDNIALPDRETEPVKNNIKYFKEKKPLKYNFKSFKETKPVKNNIKYFKEKKPLKYNFKSFKETKPVKNNIKCFKEKKPLKYNFKSFREKKSTNLKSFLKKVSLKNNFFFKRGYTRIFKRLFNKSPEAEKVNKNIYYKKFIYLISKEFRSLHGLQLKNFSNDFRFNMVMRIQQKNMYRYIERLIVRIKVLHNSFKSLQKL